MKYKNRSYPDFFPEGCPPEYAEQKKVHVYRLVSGERITIDDFKSLKELGRDARSQKHPFIEYGVSVNVDYEELMKCWRSTPSLKKKCKNICEGNIYECSGAVAFTPSETTPQKHHHTWWIYKEIDPSNFFSIKRGESSE